MPQKSKWLQEHTNLSWRISNQSSQIQFWLKDTNPEQTYTIIPLFQKVGAPAYTENMKSAASLGRLWATLLRHFQPSDWGPDKDRQKHLLENQTFWFYSKKNIKMLNYEITEKQSNSNEYKNF